MDRDVIFEDNIIFLFLLFLIITNRIYYYFFIGMDRDNVTL